MKFCGRFDYICNKEIEIVVLPASCTPEHDNRQDPFTLPSAVSCLARGGMDDLTEQMPHHASEMSLRACMYARDHDPGTSPTLLRR